ncbi:AraC family transcriptional regulator ligand-binding domain-containing protein [Shimia sp. R11_0]|uniref:AraC family transcriptional regulator n=1 Tax=Shimia sp. R11_0 TaxID=2821096 RepID=UPI001ADC720F|nr:AraC family transcriptional regulator [Shimia sp. R11_0]MBO9478859.1 AraC family transcriptional regulator ligand-binding domain-containing protein [Shimia sp. R11_0]
MQKHPRYHAHKSTPKVLEAVGISVERVLQRCGLPSDLFEIDHRGLTAEQFFLLWQAIADEANDPEIAITMARTMAQGPFIPAVFAFSCSPNIAVGLERLSVFKPLVAPVRLAVIESDRHVAMELHVIDPKLKIPECMAAFEMVYFLELCRTFTDVDLLPVEVGVPELIEHQDVYDRYFGRSAVLCRVPRLTLTKEDAHRPLVSENRQLWAGFRRELQRQLAEQNRNTSMSVRVRNALLELLPAGQASVDAVCARLVTSRRSLQRYLSSEGMTFQSILDKTRSDLSIHYLGQAGMSVEEIAYLLGYRDPNSFYRAFQNWTGQTPSQVRGSLKSELA